jgi:hypothetical protein
MAETETATTSIPRRRRRKGLEWALIIGLPAILLAPFVWLALTPVAARMGYEPAEGDVVFQSTRPSELADAIEGATRSPFSHCGIVAREEDGWYVYEALHGVGKTPLDRWLARGHGGGFAVFRFKEQYRPHVPATLAAARTHFGKEYDWRYRLGPEALYCSELVYLSYQEATGEPLGKLVTLKDLHWKPYRSLIERLEGGEPPLELEMITPRDLAEAEQLEEVYRFAL